MSLLILGVVLWWVTHTFPLVARPRRDALVAKMGEGPYKGAFALTSVGAIVLMVLGYQDADWITVWTPPTFTWHINNLLMVVAVALLGASHSKGNAKRFVRHPMLMAVVVWGVAHLLVKGHLAAVILFGGMAAWAVVAMFATNARDGAWVKPAPAPIKKDVILVGITAVVFVVVALVHLWLGVSPFPGAGAA